ncbi:MAG: M23 family metallopeptidase [Mucinivorans sp.]
MKKNSVMRYLTQKNKLTFRNLRTGEEHWHLFLSRWNMVVGLVVGILVLFLSALMLVAYTPILDLVPGYPGKRSRELLLSNVMRLDSLERRVSQWNNFNQNINDILEGKIPISMVQDTAFVASIKGTVAERVVLDSLLRLQIKGDSAKLTASGSRSHRELSFELLPPVQGMLSSRFDPRMGLFGVQITAAARSSVLSVLDGTMVLSEWSPKDGYMVAVQHAGNMMSVYRGVGEPLLKVGQGVKAGAAVALMGQMSQGRSPHLEFELWYNGSAVDPENYIAF